VVGPTGLAFDARRGVLYVASTADDAIYAIPGAAVTHHDHGKGQLFIQDNAHPHGPPVLVLATNGDLIVAKGDAVNRAQRQRAAPLRGRGRQHQRPRHVDFRGGGDRDWAPPAPPRIGGR
jgi:sugar lactone lactonase YvrE